MQNWPSNFHCFSFVNSRLRYKSVSATIIYAWNDAVLLFSFFINSELKENKKKKTLRGTTNSKAQTANLISFVTSLGLSGIDDSSIPIADWEAHRSNSDLATRLHNNLASSTSTPAPSRLKPALVDLVFAGFSFYFWV